MRLPVAVILTLGLAAGGAAAQVPGVGSVSKTDVGLSIYGAFTPSQTSNGETEAPANTAGGMVELRHLSGPILGFEGTYSYNRANETYTPDLGVLCPIGVQSCNLSQSVKAAAHEVTVDWVPSVRVGNLRPFGVLGMGALLNVPIGGQSGSQTDVEPVYVYGAGLDWGVLPHLGLRLQFRGNLFKAPNVTKLFTSIDSFRQTSEPMIGVYFRL
jgi:opacity protein-like surface antigen